VARFAPSAAPPRARDFTLDTAGDDVVEIERGQRVRELLAMSWVVSVLIVL
jgi:hypothetical protein